MYIMNDKVPTETIETFARTIYKEASSYGFGQVDMLRLVNALMDLCTTAGASNSGFSRRKQPTSTRRTPPATGSQGLPIAGERVIIREFDGAFDADLLQEWLNDRYGRYFLLSCATAQTMTLDTLTQSEANHLGIITLNDGTPIGAMAYFDHNVVQKRAELRKLIGPPEARGQGFAEEATRLWIDYGISVLDLEKIVVSTLQTNIGNIKLNEEIGFQVEGLLRNEVLIDEKRHDVLRMGMWFD